MKKVIDAQISEYRGDSTYKVRKQTGSIPSAIMPIAQKIQNSTPLPDFDEWVSGVWGENGENADAKLIKVFEKKGEEGLINELQRRFENEMSKRAKRKAEAGSSEGAKKRGRPKGSKNKPKA